MVDSFLLTDTLYKTSLKIDTPSIVISAGAEVFTLNFTLSEIIKGLEAKEKGRSLHHL